MVGLAVREGGTVAADPLLHKLTHVSGPAAEALTGLMLHPDTAAVERFLAVAPDTATGLLLTSAWVVSDADSVRLGQQIMQQARRARSPRTSGAAAPFLVALHVKAGQLSAALARGDSTLPQAAWSHMGPVLASFPFLGPSPAVVEAARRRVLTWDSTTPTTGSLGDRGRAHLRLYMLGVLSARLGAYDDALRYALDIERLPAAPDLQGVAGNLANAVRAAVAFERREYALTLTLLQRAENPVPLELIGIPPTGGERERFLRAETLLQLGRTAEALPWLENGFQTEMGEVYRAPCFLRLGEAYDQLGQPEKARHYYARALAEWSDPDPELRPRVIAARERLGRLVSERSPAR